MFKTAQLKLTAWYVLAIMLLSIIFSLVLYLVLSREIRRFGLEQQQWIERRLLRGEGDSFSYFPLRFSVAVNDPRLEQLAIKRIRQDLIAMNAIILLFSTLFSYLLAGRTLSPIQSMLEHQKRFVGDVSHELRTPLAALRTELEVNLRDETLNLKDARQNMESNLEEVKRLQSMTDSILRLSQYDDVQSKELEKVYHTTNIGLIIETAYGKIKSLAKQKKIHFELQMASVGVMGDEASLTEVFIILFDNAIKYSNADTTVKVEVLPKRKYVAISVIDQGAGIAKTELPYIFDRFYRSDKARQKTGNNGHGLGLAIAQHIIEEHHGKISVKSTLGKGSTFSVTLPKV